MLELKGLSYQVEDNGAQTDILRGIDLTIDNNKFVVITGPNGGGKTTLAKAIMGLVPATGGQILWNGTDVTHLSITERAKLGISYGFQQPPRFKGLRVRDLLALASGNRNLSRDECCSYLNRVGLCAADYVDREMDTSLSGGEVKRIEIATIDEIVMLSNGQIARHGTKEEIMPNILADTGGVCSFLQPGGNNCRQSKEG